MMKQTLKFFISLALTVFLSACGGGDDSDNSTTITILSPTSESTYFTVWPDVILGGSVSGTSFVKVTNETTGFTTDAFVNYYDGYGSWFAEIPGLVPGDNHIVASANGINAYITISRPERPYEYILNGADHNVTSTFWLDSHSFNQSHKITVYADGTGRSTTKSVLYEEASSVVDFNWTASSPDEITIINCSDCSFQKISRISGSIDEGIFFGEVETTGGDLEKALHAFILEAGNL